MKQYAMLLGLFLSFTIHASERQLLFIPSDSEDILEKPTPYLCCMLRKCAPLDNEPFDSWISKLKNGQEIKAFGLETVNYTNNAPSFINLYMGNLDKAQAIKNVGDSVDFSSPGMKFSIIAITAAILPEDKLPITVGVQYEDVMYGGLTIPKNEFYAKHKLEKPGKDDKTELTYSRHVKESDDPVVHTIVTEIKATISGNEPITMLEDFLRKIWKIEASSN